MQLEKNILIGSVLALFSVLFLSGGIFFGQKYFKLQSTGSNLDAEVMKLTDTENRLLEVNPQTKKIDENLTTALTSFPSDPSVPFFMTQLEIAAKEAGLDVERLSFIKAESQNKSESVAKKPTSVPVAPGSAVSETVVSESTPSASVYEVAVNGVFKGSLVSLEKFLKAIETARRITAVKNIKIDEEKSSTGESIGFTISISFVSYYMPKAVIAGGDQKPAMSSEFNATINEISTYRYYGLSSIYAPVPATSSPTTTSP